MAKYPKHLLSLIEHFRKFPGVGYKTAERYAFHLINWKESETEAFGELVKNTSKEVQKCPSCFFLIGNEGCPFCSKQNRDTTKLCIVGSSKEAFSIESTGEFQGVYHVLTSLFSPSKGMNVQDIGIDKIVYRIKEHSISEVILALDATFEGDATSLYIKQALKEMPVEVSRLAFGIPIGSSFEFIDGGTLAKAFLGRSKF